MRGLGETREGGKVQGLLITLAGTAFALFYIYSAVGGNFVTLPFTSTRFYLPAFPFHVFVSMFIFFTGFLTFILYPAREKSPKNRISAVDAILCLLLIAVTIDFITNFAPRGEMAGIVSTQEMVFGTIAIVLCFEMCRRVLGPILPIVTVVFLIYLFFGYLFPRGLSHEQMPARSIISFIYSQEGIYGVVTNVFATYVFLFMVLGSIFTVTRVGDVFVDLAFAIVGRTNGGAAKAAIMSSGLVGSMVGSGSANICITGTFTIPLMKRAGYSPTFAGGVEAVASIGGHIMPPVMGASAFIMASFTETPYVEICLIAAVPAILYYICLFMSAHFYATKNGIVGLPREELPSFWGTLKKGWILLTPIVLLIVLLLYRYTPFYAAFWAILGSLAAAMVKKETRLSPRRLILALATGAKNSLIIGVTGGVMGIVLACVTLPGLALTFSALVLSYSHNILIVAIILIGIAAYILGMGLTQSASYIILSILAVPALMELGVPRLTANLAILWFCLSAPLTPPFCLGAFTAAGLAQTDPMKTGFVSVRLAQPVFVLPLIMIYGPLLMTGTWTEVIICWVAVAFGFISSSAALEGCMFVPLRFYERVILAVSALLLFWPQYLLDLAGLIILAVIFFSQKAKKQKIGIEKFEALPVIGLSEGSSSEK